MDSSAYLRDKKDRIMITQHTSGPWKAEKYCIWGGLNYEIYVAGTQTALAVETQQANARLIAAAPDLLAALQEFMREDDPHTVNCATQPTWASGRSSPGPCDCRYGRARAAIAKAEGKGIK